MLRITNTILSPSIPYHNTKYENGRLTLTPNEPPLTALTVGLVT